MEKVRKQIRESFFNPVLHILPLPVFMVVEEFWNTSSAWMTIFPLFAFLLLYVYFLYSRIFGWYILFQSVFVGAISLSCLSLFLGINKSFHHIMTELFVFISLSGLLFYRKKIQKTVSDFVPKIIPMSNNFRETNRLLIRFTILLGTYLTANIIFNINGNIQHATQSFLRESFYTLIGGLLAYELIRVQIIRNKLVREEWWPIVTEQGKVIGSIQHLTSLNDRNKFMHPIVRVMVIDNGMILLQKRPSNSIIYSGLWDTAITNHVRMGESIEQCIDRTASEKYNMNNMRYMYLSNYTLESAQEFHYAFLFVSCQQVAYYINPGQEQQLKWWTKRQIEENLNSDIFTENFKTEFDLLKRSGLLESGKCECNCRLKEAIAQQSKQVIKSVE